MKTTLFAAAALAISAGAAAAAPAPSVGFTLTLSGNVNSPDFTLTNISSGAVTLDSFSFDIGDTSRNFDEVSGFSSAANMTLTAGDTAQGGARTDDFSFAFTGMAPAVSYGWQVDVDVDNANTLEDYRTVFFNNGTAANSVAVALFSNGKTVTFTLPDDASASSYTYSASMAVSDVPVPAALPLLAAALGGLGLLRRRR